MELTGFDWVGAGLGGLGTKVLGTGLDNKLKDNPELDNSDNSHLDLMIGELGLMLLLHLEFGLSKTFEKVIAFSQL